MADFKFLHNLHLPWAIRQDFAVGALPLIEKIYERDSNYFAGFSDKRQAQTAPRIVAMSDEEMEEYNSIQEVPEDRESVSVIRVSGALTKHDYCGQPGMQTLSEWLLAADQADEIKAHVLVYETPGGTVAGTDAFSNVIRTLSKPHVALIEDECCSAGYWLASNSKTILLNSKTCLVGCLGVMVQLREYNDEYVKEHHITSSGSKEKNRAVLEAKKGNYALIQERILDPLASVFTQTVSNNRADKLNLASENVFSGREYVGQAAIDAGLADGFGSLADAVTTALNLSNLKNADMKNPFKKSEETKAKGFDISGLTAEQKQELMASLNAETNNSSANTAEEEADEEAEGSEEPNANSPDASVTAAINARFDQFQAQLDSLKAENDSLKAENKKLGGASADPVTVDPKKDKDHRQPEANYLTEIDKELIAQGFDVGKGSFKRVKGDGAIV